MEPTDERPFDRLIAYMVSGAQEIAAQEIELEAEMDDGDEGRGEGAGDEDEVDDVWEGWR